MYKPCLIVVLNNTMQVYFVLQNELLQAGILELDTLFSLVTTLDFNFCDLSISVKIRPLKEIFITSLLGTMKGTVLACVH